MTDLGLNAGTISFIFTDDIFLREINRKFLEHDYYTDVITFNLSEQEGLLDGEIYISTETVKSNSITYGTAFEDEIKRVMVHGILHLAGYIDDTDDQREEMRRMENRYLEKF